MKKLLVSMLTVGVVGAAAIAGANAFFSDTETSTGNVLGAGTIDLGIDNHSYYNGVLNPGTTWRVDYDFSDTPHQYFNFADVKPGDWGEDTISLHVKDNDSYLCADVTLTSDDDNGVVDPEGDDGDITDGAGNGELADAINFYWWADDGDNVFEVGETLLPAGPMGTLSVGQTATVALADSQTNIWGTTPGPLPGDTVRYVAKAWCFGDTTMTPYTQDGGNLGSGPDVRPLTCDGSGENNVTQTDMFTADISFRAVQSRNNTGFVCEPPVAQRPLVGAALSAYVAPETCNVTVDETGGNPALDTIQEGVDVATAGQTVCVKAGAYLENVNVNKSITLAGDGPTAVTLTGVGTGEAGALVVTADSVTVKGFKVIGTGVSAMRISNPHTGITFSFNNAVAASGQNALLMDGGQSNHTVSSNVFEGASSQLAYVNGLASVSVASTNVDFLNNTFSGSGNMALGQEAGGSDVKLNKFSTVTSFTDIEDWEGGNLYNQNNFNDAGLNLQHSENGATGDNGITSAENNWWGDADPSDGDVNANVDVDFTPFEASAFTEN